MKTAYIGARVDADLRAELLAIAALLRLPYSEVLALLLRSALPALRCAAERAGGQAA